MKLKAAYVGRFNEENQLYTVCRENNKKIKDDLSKLSSKIRALNPRSNQRNKLKTQYGPWYVLEKDGWGYAVCVNEDYPERHAYGFIQKISAFVESKKGMSDSKFQKQLRKYIEQTTGQYQDLNKMDKVKQAQAEADLLQNDLQTGIRKILNGKQNLDELSNQAEQMKSYAKQFENNCTTLEQISFWHKWKFILLLVIILLGMISLVAVTIMIKY